MMTIIELRTKRGLTQNEMANRLNVSVQTYIRWEAKPHRISLLNAFRIAEILNVSIDDITFLS